MTKTKKSMKQMSIKREAGQFPLAKAEALMRRRRALPQLVEQYLRISREDLLKAGIDLSGRKGDRDVAGKLVVSTAVHEAGHAVMVRVATGTFPVLVSIERGSDQLEPGWGFTRRETSVVERLTPEQIDELRRTSPVEVFDRVVHFGAALDAMVFVAGPSAEALTDVLDGLLDSTVDDAPVPDFRQAQALLSKVERDESACTQWFNDVFDVTLEVLRVPEVWEAVQSLAEALLNNPTLDEEVLVELLTDVPSLPELVERWRSERAS